MLRSKASAALERLKEFDKKYKLKGEATKSESESEGTTEGIRVSSPGRIHSGSKELTVVPLKSKLDIRIPDAPLVESRHSELPNSVGESRTSSDASSQESSRDDGNAGKTESISTHEDISNPALSSITDSFENNRSYKSDTFEDASSSVRTRYHSQAGEGETSFESLARMGKQVIELVSPKPVQSASECEIGLDEELSDYVKLMEALEQDSIEIGPITLLKSSVKHADACNIRAKERKATSSIEELSINEEIDARSSKTSPIHPQETTAITNESLSDPKLDEPSDKSEKEVVEPNKSTDLLETPEDDASATRVLRKLNREAINAIVKRHRVTENKQSPRKTSSVEEDTCQASSRRCKSKRKQHSRSNTRRCINSRVRDEKTKEEKLDSKESVDAERRRLIGLRLQREREDLGVFRQELDNIRVLNCSQSIPKPPLIKPLELPNIESYQRSEDVGDSTLLTPITDIERLGEKLCEIQYWLKDQYTLYREYSKLAQIMNARYVPSNLQDAKEVIRELKSRTSKITRVK